MLISRVLIFTGFLLFAFGLLACESSNNVNEFPVDAGFKGSGGTMDVTGVQPGSGGMPGGAGTTGILRYFVSSWQSAVTTGKELDDRINTL